MTKEAKARILINDLLARSDWRFFDDENALANIALEANVKIKKKTLDALGEDFEKTVNGYVDYLLLDARGFPIEVMCQFVPEPREHRNVCPPIAIFAHGVAQKLLEPDNGTRWKGIV